MDESLGETFAFFADGSSGNIMLEIAFVKLQQEAFEIFKRKQASYGSGNIATFGARGVFIRMWDKVQRLFRLVWLGKKDSLGADETILDTYLDLANYSLISILCIKGNWSGLTEEEGLNGKV